MKILAFLLAFAVGTACAQSFEIAPFSPPRLDALIHDTQLNEISGIAASRRADDLYWVHNDAPRPAELHALNDAGERKGRVRIEGVRATDWEDIASYTLDGKAWLLIGDVGDNGGVRKDYELIAIEEPQLPVDGQTVVVKPAWRLRFRYPDAAHDCEAIAVDVRTRTIFLLTKRTAQPILYSLPLGAGDGSTQVAQKLLEITSIPRPTAIERLAKFPAARYGGWPTSMDIDDAGQRALVLTYRDLWIFPRADGESWAQAFAKKPQRLPLPAIAQAEAAAFDRRRGSILVSGERTPAPWLRFDPIR